MDDKNIHFAGYTDFVVRPTTPEEKVKQKKKNKSKKLIDSEREKYFTYYDDVKDRTKPHEDW